MRNLQFQFRFNFKAFLLFWAILLAFARAPSFAQSCRVYSDFLPYTITNTGFTFNSIDCDPCIFGAAGARNYCCRKDCIEKSLKCRQNCIQIGGGLQAIGLCMDQCNDVNNTCVNKCGLVPDASRIAVAYGVGVRVWTSEGLLAPSTINPPNYSWSSGVNAIVGAPPTSISMPIPVSLNFTTKAHCLFAYIRIFYNDGSCCDFITFQCKDIG
jgi:hypothetical protein